MLTKKYIAKEGDSSKNGSLTINSASVNPLTAYCTISGARECKLLFGFNDNSNSSFGMLIRLVINYLQSALMVI